MSRYNIPYEWRKYTGSVEVDPGNDVADFIELEVTVETFWIQQTSTSPYGSTYATDEWYEFDDSTEPKWSIEGVSLTYDQVVERIGEEEAQNVLEKAIHG